MHGWMDRDYKRSRRLYFRALSGSMAESTQPQNVQIPLNNQSIVLPGEERIHLSHLAPDGKLLEYAFEDAKTVYEAFLRGMRVSNDGPCLGERIGEQGEGPYEFIKYSQVLKRAHNFGAGLERIGLKLGQQGRLGIYSLNCMNWTIAALSCNAYSRVVVPLYATLGKEAIAHIINEAELVVIVCQPSNVPSLLEGVSAYPALRHIITWGSPQPEHVLKLAEEYGVTLLTADAIEKFGEEYPIEPQSPTPDDLAIICYTSGTTGLPKGVMTPHRSIMATCAGLYQLLLSAGLTMGPDDSYLSFLPLAHTMEQVGETNMFLSGGRIGFYRGNPKLIMEDVKALQPSIFAGVPRIFTKIYDKVQIGLQGSFVKRQLVSLGLWWKGKSSDRGILRQDTVFDSLVFKRIREVFGGRVRIVVTGAAPIQMEVLRFFRIALGVPILEAYGQTETSSGGTCTLGHAVECGNVGPPIASSMIKLTDVPEMNYSSKNDEGEICFKGPTLFTGYWKNEAKTKEALDEDGWLHSGDIGRWLPNGALQIIDRKKEIFKTSTGEYIAPSKVENIYNSRSLFVAQCLVVGRSLKATVVAIIVPDQEYLAEWANLHGFAGGMEELCGNAIVRKAVLDDITKAGNEGGLKSFEQAKAIYLHPKEFSVDDGHLTPTQKLVRRKIDASFSTQIEEMYSSLP